MLNFKRAAEHHPERQIDRLTGAGEEKKALGDMQPQTSHRFVSIRERMPSFRSVLLLFAIRPVTKVVAPKTFLRLWGTVRSDLDSSSSVAGEALKASPAWGELESSPVSEKVEMTPSYPPFCSVPQLDDESDLGSLPVHVAAKLREARQFCKQQIERLAEVYTPIRSQLEREHWGHYIIFHLPTGRFIVADDDFAVEQQFMGEFMTTDDSFGFRIGG